MIGITLINELSYHTESVNRVSWSNNGSKFASCSDDKRIIIWALDSKEPIAVLSGHDTQIVSIVWSQDDTRIISKGVDDCIFIWDLKNNDIVQKLDAPDAPYFNISLVNDRLHFSVGSAKSNIGLWDFSLSVSDRSLDSYFLGLSNVSRSPNGSFIAIVEGDKGVSICDNAQGGKYSLLGYHDGQVLDMAWSKDSKLLATGSDDKTIRIWDIIAKKLSTVIEGHSGHITSLDFSSDGLLLATKDANVVFIWQTSTWSCLAELSIPSQSSLSFHPKAATLLIAHSENHGIQIWEYDYKVLARQARGLVHYTTARLVLVGDSGVGKTGLGLRIAHNEYKADISSTHGQQFWIVERLSFIRDDGTECEAVLWDLAGQPEYRLIHSLFLNNVDVALILFDPTVRIDVLTGVDFWMQQLKQSNQSSTKSILVGARIDLGISSVSQDMALQYCEKNQIEGGYLITSAKTGMGIDALLGKIKELIPWDSMTPTVTNLTFKKIKKFVLELKENSDSNNVLVEPNILFSMLKSSDTNWIFELSDMMTAVGHLENHGYVRLLKGTGDREFILLQPDLLANLASSIVIEAQNNIRGLGLIEEKKLLSKKYKFPEIDELSIANSEILLAASASLFLTNNICFRETFNELTFLVFPSLIRDFRPRSEDKTGAIGASYQVKGAVENIYASLVVLLGYTNTFVNTNHWQNQAQYETANGEVCGFKKIECAEDEIELVLYYGMDPRESLVMMFQGIFERLLSHNPVRVVRYDPVHCSGTSCTIVLNRDVVRFQLSEGKRHCYCSECGVRLTLPDPKILFGHFASDRISLSEEKVTRRRTIFETFLIRLKSLVSAYEGNKRLSPSCFISYSWENVEDSKWVLQFAKDLRHAEVDVLLDRWHCPPGTNLDFFCEKILTCKFVIPIGTPSLKAKYSARNIDPVLAAELKLLNLRVRNVSEFGNTVLPIILQGNAEVSLTPQLQTLVYLDFRESELYFHKLIDVIWRLYDLPFDHIMLDELRAELDS